MSGKARPGHLRSESTRKSVDTRISVGHGPLRLVPPRDLAHYLHAVARIGISGFGGKLFNLSDVPD